MESLEIEYESARIFRQLLIPRLLGFTAAIGAAVILAHLPWSPIVAAIGLECLLIVFTLRHEHRARRRWLRATSGLTDSPGILQQNGIRPTAQSRCSVDGPDPARPSSAADRRGHAEAPAVHQR